jgi:hypothetical protein
MAWTRIVRSGKPRVKGINSQYSGLINVEVDLEPTPPREWADFFSQPLAVPTKASMHPPKLSGSTVMLQPPDNELEAYVANVDARIEAANDFFERQVLPSLEAAEVQARQRRDDDQRRIDDARRKAEDL